MARHQDETRRTPIETHRSKRQTEHLHKRIDAEVGRLAPGDAHDHDTRSSVMLSLCRRQTLQGIFLRTCWLHSDDTRELRVYIKSSWLRRSIHS